MKNKILLVVVAIAMLFAITGCGKKETPSTGGEKNNDYTIGDTVETDIARIKLYDAKYTYALRNVNDEDFGKPKEYNPSTDSRNPYVASKGHTLVSFAFMLENLDRGNLDLGGSFNDTFAQVKYNGKKYGDDNEEVTEFIAVSQDNFTWESYISDNILMLPGEKEYYRAYFDIPVDVQDLEQDVELIIYLPNSSGKQKAFTFVVTKNDRANSVEEEISLDTAVKNFRTKEANEYFTNHMSEYTKLNTDEIITVVKGRKYKVSVNGWEGSFKFEESKNIYEGDNEYAVGYTNKRKWNVKEDKLELYSGTTKKTNACEMYKVEDGTYLLIKDSKPFGILY